jgi:hypothetical protein
MKSIGLKGYGLRALAVAAATLALQAQAAPVVWFSPSSQDATGPTATVDIVVSGLTEALSTVALNVNYSSANLTGLSYTVDPTDAMHVDDNPALNDFSPGFGLGTLDLVFAYDMFAFTDAAALFAAEGSGADLKLATVTFNTGTAGLSTLSFTGVSLAGFPDANGDSADLHASGRPGSICVGGTCNVPEPTSPLLVFAALSALALSRKSKQA